MIFGMLFDLSLCLAQGLIVQVRFRIPIEIFIRIQILTVTRQVEEFYERRPFDQKIIRRLAVVSPRIV